MTLKTLFCFLILFTLTRSLNILFVLPCYGGHFGAMSNLVAPFARRHQVTVIATSPLCEKKFTPIQKLADFETIYADIAIGEKDLSGLMMFFMKFGPGLTEMVESVTNYLEVFLKENSRNFDIIICDLTQEGVLIAAEMLDIPVAVLMTGSSGVAEKIQDKGGETIFGAIFFKLVLLGHKRFLQNFRSEKGLPDLALQDNIFPWDYVSRFPLIIATSPKFYPEPHPIVDHVFIGGHRNQSDHQPLPAELANWIPVDSRNIIYVSLGTHTKLDEQAVLDFVRKAKTQTNYRFIWALGTGMQRVVRDLGFEPDDCIYFSKFLPQYTLLGHPKVKVFVTHGGLLSLIDTIKQRKPVVCIPHFGDQFMNCQKMTSFNVGETLSSFNFVEIMKAVDRVFSDYGKFVEGADILANDFEKFEDFRMLDDFVAKIAARKKVSMIQEYPFQVDSDAVIRVWMLLKVCAITTVLILIYLAIIILRFIWKCFTGSKRQNKKVKNQ